MSLKTPETVRKLQRAFYAKAKEQPSYRYHQLYDKIYRRDILNHAFWRCVANCRDLASGGAAGVDGQTFEAIFEYGHERWLSELVEDLRKKGYQPEAVRRVWIRKANGGRRPLGIATIKDRVVQMAIVTVIEPIFEADLEPEQYGYRRGRSAQDAVRAVHRWLQQGYRDVIDADLSGYFDSIPHAELIQCVARRISDREMLALIKRFLKPAYGIETSLSNRTSQGRRRRGPHKVRHYRRCWPISISGGSSWDGKSWVWWSAIKRTSSTTRMISWCVAGIEPKRLWSGSARSSSG